MRRITLLTILTLLTVSVFAQKQKYSISGHIDGIQSDKIYLEQNINNKFMTIDSSKITNGAFLFKGEVTNGVNFAAIRVPKVRGYIAVFTESGNIKVNAKIGAWNLAEIKGGKNGEALSEVYNNEVTYYDKSMEYLALYQKMMREKKRDSVNYYLKLHKEYIAKGEENIANFMKESKGSAVALYYFRMNKMNKTSDYNEVAEFLNDYDSLKFASNNDYVMIKNYLSLLDKIRVGSVIEDIILPQQDGKILKLSQFRGKYVLIDFWASWCAPCRNEGKHILKLYEQYGWPNFEVLGVSIDNEPTRWVKAIEDDKTPWQHVLDKESLYKAKFGISSIPILILISPEGKIIDNKTTAEKLSVFIENLGK